MSSFQVLPIFNTQKAQKSLRRHLKATSNDLLFTLASSFVSSPLPGANANISLERPLFFFHQRKTRGMSVRATLWDMALKNNLSSFIPCFDGVPCDTTVLSNLFYAGHFIRGEQKDLLANRTFTGGRPPNEQDFVVYAGHFVFGEQKNLLRNHAFFAGEGRPPKQDFSCLTFFRDPVERVISCYYFRFIQEGNGGLDSSFLCMNDVPNSSLEAVLRYGTDEFGDGCLDEPFRIFSGIYNPDQFSLADDVESPKARAVLSQTLENLSRCVLLDVGDTRSSQEILQSWLPQLRLPSETTLNKGAVPRCHLSREKEQLLQRLTRAETVVYRAVESRVRRFVEAAEQRSRETSSSGLNSQTSL
jgi:hypothetical protein